MERVKALLMERGHKALEVSRESVLLEQIAYKSLQEALRYFMEEWCDVAHPTLLSLACEAVGGNPDATTSVGAALVLLAGAADVHDDIIDQSTIKDSKPTVFGKFGKDIAIILGDVLWFKGLFMLHEACEPFRKEQREAILKLAKQAFFDIGSAEAEEANFRGKLDLSPDEYLNIIKMKVSVAEAAAKIGAILGNGTPEEVESLGHYGKTLGTLMTIRDEFIDVFELDELRNRFENECLPLPVLNAFRDPARKIKIIHLLKRKAIAEKEMEGILDLVINAEENRELGKEMRLLITEETRRLGFVRKNINTLVLLLESTPEDIPH